MPAVPNVISCLRRRLSLAAKPWHALWLGPLLALPLPPVEAAEHSFMVGYGYHNAPPYAIVSDGTLHSGIIKDIAEALAKEANLTLAFKIVNRINMDNALTDGTLDMNCITNPNWLDTKDQLIWSQPLFVERDLIYSRVDDPREINELSDLQLTRLGTIRGFHYPLLNDLMAEHAVQRSDASSHADNFLALKEQQVDFVIADNITTGYMIHQNGQPLKRQPLTISEHSIHCAFSASSQFDTKALAIQLNELVSRGEIEKIINRYLGDVPGGR